MNHDLTDMARSLPVFMDAMWSLHRLDKVAPLEPMDYQIADWLQNGPDRSITMAFRGQGKSYKTDCYICWELFSAQLHKGEYPWVLLVSASEKLAKHNLHLIKQWFATTPWLQPMCPRKGTKERDGAIEFDLAGNTAKNPSIAAVGITGQMTGRRAHIIVPDDVETLETALTVDQRQRLRDRITEFDSIALPGGKIRYLMTPQHVDTIALTLTRDLGFQCRSWPARYPASKDHDKILGLAPQIAQAVQDGTAKPGEPTCPRRFDEETLIQKEGGSGRSKWMREFMLHVGEDELSRCPLRLSDLIVHPVNATKAPITIQWGLANNAGSTRIEHLPSVGNGNDGFYAPIYIDQHWEAYHCTKMYVDPAGRGPDETAWAIVGQLHGNLFVKQIDAYQQGHDTENLDRIARDARRHHVNDLYIESQFGGEMLAQLLKPRLERLTLKPGQDDAYPHGWACSVNLVHSRGQKELRIIDALEPLLNQHRIILDTQLAVDQDLGIQLTQITRQRHCLQHDDRIEALAACCAQFTCDLDRDAQAYKQHLEDQERDQMIYDYQNQPEEKPTLTWCHY